MLTFLVMIYKMKMLLLESSLLIVMLVLCFGFQQVLTIEWSPGLEVLRCVGRTELKLHGSFADMILLSSPGSAGDDPKVDLFVLTNPGKLHFYEKTTLSAIIGKSKTDSKLPVSPLEFPAMIPAAEPPMTTSKFIKLPIGGFSTKILSEVLYSLPYI